VTDQDEVLARKVSDRYWASDESVNGIAEALSVSKGRLYELIRPLAVEGSCPTCGGGPPVHPNRTARDRGQVECPHCGWEGKLDELAAEPPVETAGRPAPSVVELNGPDAVRWDRPEVLGGVLVGMAAGFLLSRWLR
jgi:predicted RNA-binding Zn-ribbon protein involved in translation (DUF1610 family)